MSPGVNGLEGSFRLALPPIPIYYLAPCKVSAINEFYKAASIAVYSFIILAFVDPLRPFDAPLCQILPGSI